MEYLTKRRQKAVMGKSQIEPRFKISNLRNSIPVFESASARRNMSNLESNLTTKYQI